MCETVTVLRVGNVVRQNKTKQNTREYPRDETEWSHIGPATRAKHLKILRDEEVMKK
jgi:hypothetical protein